MQANGDTYYVSSTAGNDSYDGLSPETAKLTIQAAINVAASGDTIIVASGTYNENLIIDKSLNVLGPNAGVNPNTETRVNEAIITIETVPGGSYLGIVNIVTGGSDTIFDGFEVRSETQSNTIRGIQIDNANNVTIRNSRVHHISDVLIYPNNSNFLTIENNELYDSPDEAVKVASSLAAPHTSNDVTIKNNVIYDARAIWVYAGSRWNISGNILHDVEFGMALDSGGSHTAGNNLIYNFNTAGIKAEKTSTIINNTITGTTGSDNSSYYGAGIAVKSGFTGGIIKNNIIVSCKKGIYLRDGAPVVSIDYNDVWGNTISDYSGFSTGLHDISADPLFISSSDYHLKSMSGSYHNGEWLEDDAYSPAVDAGDPTSEFLCEPSPNGSRINMGAYGNTPQASKSYSSPSKPDSLELNSVMVGETLTALASGSTVSTASGSITYYYKFYNVSDDMRLRQDWSSMNTYTVAEEDASDIIRVYTKAFDRYNYSEEYENEITVSNTPPTTPTTLTLTSVIHTGETLTATASGSTDYDGDDIVYYYMFFNFSSAITLQDWDSTNTYSVSISADSEIIVYAKAYDGYSYSDNTNSSIIVKATVDEINQEMEITETVNSINITDAPANTPINFNNSSISISAVLGNEVSELSIIVSDVDVTAIQNSGGPNYKCVASLNISIDGDSVTLLNTRATIRVNIRDIIRNNIDPSSLFVERNGAKLNNVSINRSNSSYLLSFSTPGFSTFNVFGRQYNNTNSIAIQNELQLQEFIRQSQISFIVSLGILGVALMLFIRYCILDKMGKRKQFRERFRQLTELIKNSNFG